MNAARRRQRGMTLVELLVGLTIGLIVSLAASALYLATNETSRATSSVGDINETGKLVLDNIGREIQKAGFYPAQYPSSSSTPNFMGAFFNGKAGGKDAFKTGLYGCYGAKYRPATHDCGTDTTTEPDTIIINYFATPEFGTTSLLGNSNDCNRHPVSGDADNATRVTAKMPLFVSNRYGLIDSSYDNGPDGKVATKSLVCHGNGDDTATDPLPQLQGIKDLVIRYGVYSKDTSQSPDKWLTAADVNLDTAVVDSRTSWQRVTAVKICVLVQSLSRTRTEDKAGNVRTYLDCHGAPQTPASTDRYIYKRFERVYAVRNNLTG